MNHLRRAARLAGTLVAVCLGTLGVLAGTAPVVVALVVVAFLAGLGGYAVAQRHARPVTPDVIRFAATGMAAVLVLAGLVVLLGPPAAPVAVLVAAGLGWRHRYGAARRTDPRPGVRADEVGTAIAIGPVVGASAVPAAGLTALTNAQLGREWRRSHTRLLRARGADELGYVYVLRRRQLDEIERRDPAGFSRWLDSGSWVRSDSAPFLGGAAADNATDNAPDSTDG